MKRIRVEMDVTDTGEEWLRQGVGAGDRSINTFGTIRSVEVVEPDRYTELTLRQDGDRADDWTPGVAVLVAAVNGPLTDAERWIVTNCASVVVYPDDPEAR